MGLRDIVVFLIVFGGLPFIFWRPYLGVLLWSWLSYMNPHRLTYGFAYNTPFAQVVAITLLLAMLFSREKKVFPVNGTTVVWLLFIAWMCLTTAFAVYPELAVIQLEKVLKIQLITLLTLILINTREKMDHLIIVIVASIGFFSIKGGIFTIVSGGAFRVYGPADSFIQENNALAVATLMTIPLAAYLYHIYKDRQHLRWIIGGSIGLSLISVIGSQSRGALLTILVVAGYFWLKSRSKLVTGPAIILSAVLMFSFMPDSWHERMASIRNYQEDISAMQRLNSWQYCLNVANDSILGAGFSSWTKDMFQQYAPNPEWVYVAHSIYFSMIADHGWLGLILFLTILGLTWRSLSAIIANRDDRYLPKDVFLAKMLKISMVAYMFGGAFLSLAYFDLPWHMIAIAVLLRYFGAESSEKAGRRVVPRVGPGYARKHPAIYLNRH